MSTIQSAVFDSVVDLEEDEIHHAGKIDFAVLVAEELLQVVVS